METSLDNHIFVNLVGALFFLLGIITTISYFYNNMKSMKSPTSNIIYDVSRFCLVVIAIIFGIALMTYGR